MLNLLCLFYQIPNKNMINIFFVLFIGYLISFQVKNNACIKDFFFSCINYHGMYIDNIQNEHYKTF